MSKSNFVRQLFLAAIASASIASPAGATLSLDDGGTTTIDAASEDVEVSDGPGSTTTTLNIVDGAEIGVNGDDEGVLLTEHSLMQMTGGEIEGHVLLDDEAMAIVTGGVIAGDVEVAGDARFDLGGDGTLEGDVTVEGSARFEMTGGLIEGEIVLADDAVGVFSGGELDDTLVAEDAAIVTIQSVAVGDVEAADSAIINFHDGEVTGTVEAEGSSVINILGGTFPAVFSDGEDVVATSATIHITGGVFGEAGLDDGSSVRAGFNGKLTFINAQIAGADIGDAPTATIGASLNGQVDVMSVDFGDLVLESGNNGVVNVSDVTARDVTVSTIAGGVVNILGGEFDSLEVVADLGGLVNISGGTLADADLTALAQSVIRIYGSSFTVNGVPVGFGAVPLVAGSIDGMLADGSPFSATFRRQFNPVANAAQIILSPVPVPEPGALTLACGALVGVAMLKNKHRRGLHRRPTT